MSEPFNSSKHALSFLKRRGVTDSTEVIGTVSYIIVKRKVNHDAEIEALRYLRDKGLDATMDKACLYRP